MTNLLKYENRIKIQETAVTRNASYTIHDIKEYQTNGDLTVKIASLNFPHCDKRDTSLAALLQHVQCKYCYVEYGEEMAS
jgi:hypothetical protein